MYSIINTNGIQKSCYKVEWGRTRSRNNFVSIQKCILNWSRPLEKFLIRKYFFFFSMKATKRHCKSEHDSDKCSLLEKCIMYFVSVWIPVNMEGHSDFWYQDTRVLGNHKIWVWIAGDNEPFTEIFNCLLTLI